MRRGPQARKNLGSTGRLSLTALHQFERLITELIHTRIRVELAMCQPTGVKACQIRLHLWQR